MNEQIYPISNFTEKHPMMKHVIIILTVALIAHLPIVAQGQKGANNQSGIAGTQMDLEFEDFHVKVVDIKIGPCQNTRGRSYSGTHLIVMNEKSNTRLNIHLGPTHEVSPLTEQLSIGDTVIIKAFKTLDLQANTFIAKEITLGELRYELRDHNLRPFWAGVW